VLSEGREYECVHGAQVIGLWCGAWRGEVSSDSGCLVILFKTVWTFNSVRHSNVVVVVVVISAWSPRTVASPPSIRTWRLVSRGQQEVYCCPCGVGQATCSEGGLDIASNSNSGLEGDRVTDLCGTTRLDGQVCPLEVWLHVQPVSCDDGRLEPAQDWDLSDRKRLCSAHGPANLFVYLALACLVLLSDSLSTNTCCQPTLWSITGPVCL